MKRFLFASMLTLIIVLTVGFPSVAVAQDDNCSAELSDSWRRVADAVFLSYNNAMEISDDIEAVAALQALRRSLDEAERTTCDNHIYEALVGALNFAADSRTLTALNKPDDTQLAADLMAMAETQHAEAGNLLSGELPTIATITSPEEDEVVQQQPQVSGTYNPDLITDDQHLWLFVLATNGSFYPQANNGCPGDQREPIPFRSFDQTWSMVIALGGDQDSGRDFTLLLGTVDNSANDILNARFDGWCATSDFTGLTSDEFDALNVVLQKVVNVTRE